ncbi:MAG TPA: DUF3160 domain-containing protein [Actinomycetaceae bacterium]|nr:DUF3160 domain-containing protein [Actinomycetaceae bacterium]
MKRTVAFVIAAAILFAAGCGPGEPEPTASPGVSPAETPSASATAPATAPATVPVSFQGLPTTAQVAFADFAGVPLLDSDEPAYGGEATPSSLDDVEVAPDLSDVIAEPGVSDALAEQGFVVVPWDYNQLHFAYDDNLYSEIPSYVTTDAAYHVWHLVFDKLLREIELEVLLPATEELVGGLLSSAEAQAEELAGTELADAADRAVQLYQVAAAALGQDVDLGPLAAQEMELILARGATLEISPITGCQVAYSMFTPRGHYTRSEDLTRYFLGTSVLGQLGFCLPGTLGAPGGDAAHDPMRLAVLATRPLVADAELLALWETIAEPTAFLVGVADDYRPHEFADAAAAVDSAWLDDPTALASDEALAGVVDELAATREVLINPDRAAVLLMGTRFVLDAWMMDRLLPPNVGAKSDGELRTLPSALDVAAALGSELAFEIQDEAGASDFAGYEEELSALRDAVEERPVEEWGNTVYDAWLYSIAASFAERGEAFPDYQRSEAWAAKGLQSGLGSYAELKHDTILYAKQAFAEMGGDFDLAEPRNWVEPDPVVFERLSAMTELMRTGLVERELIAEGGELVLLDDMLGLFDFLAGVARAELAGDEVSRADQERLRFMGEELEGFAMRTSDQDEYGIPERDQDAAIVADIATGVSEDGSTAVLEVATGRFDRLLVIVPADGGGFQVASGAVYSFYEFTSETGERLTDEAWRAILDTGTPPARPMWQEVFLVPASASATG